MSTWLSVYGTGYTNIYTFLIQYYIIFQSVQPIHNKTLSLHISPRFLPRILN